MKLAAIVLASVCTLALSACGGKNDPVSNALNDALDIELQRFELSRTEINPGQNIELEWRTTGAFRFDMKAYVSEDTFISSDDVLIIDEECSPNLNSTCAVAHDNVFDCDYENDLSFDCWHDDRRLQTNDLTPFLDTIPKDSFIILQICNDDDCDQDEEALRFL